MASFVSPTQDQISAIAQSLLDKTIPETTIKFSFANGLYEEHQMLEVSFKNQNDKSRAFLHFLLAFAGINEELILVQIIEYGDTKVNPTYNMLFYPTLKTEEERQECFTILFQHLETLGWKLVLNKKSDSYHDLTFTYNPKSWISSNVDDVFVEF
jgi:hypothetical protein